MIPQLRPQKIKVVEDEYTFNKTLFYRETEFYGWELNINSGPGNYLSMLNFRDNDAEVEVLKIFIEITDDKPNVVLYVEVRKPGTVMHKLVSLKTYLEDWFYAQMQRRIKESMNEMENLDEL